MQRHIAIYVRVSSKRQDLRSQRPDLERWSGAFADGRPIVWYSDKMSGRTMSRPGWQKLEQAMAAGQVEMVVCWRLDRLGRTASGLTALFDELQRRKIGLVSIKDALDLSTPAGRLMCNVLASVAAFETEVRGERVLAGQAAARANGKKWGGSSQGKRRIATAEKADAVRDMKADGKSIAAISRIVGLSRPTIYSLLATQL